MSFENPFKQTPTEKKGEWRNCDACNGIGKIKDKKCEKCNGSGKLPDKH